MLTTAGYDMGKNKHIKGTTGKNNREAKSRRDPSEDCFPVWIFTKVDVSGKFAFDVSRHDFDSKYVLVQQIPNNLLH